MPVPTEFKGLLEALPDGVVMVDTEGRIVLANGLFERMSGYSRDQLVGERIEMLVPMDRRDEHRIHRAGFAEQGYPSRPMGAGLDIALQRSDGSTIPVDIALSTLTADDTTYVFAAVRDITERQRTEARIRSVNEVAQSILTGGSTEGLLHQVAHSAASLIGASVGAVMVPSPDRGNVVRAAQGRGADALRGLAIDGGFAADDVMETGRSVLIEDVSADPRCPADVVEAADLGSVILVPLWVRGDPFGSLLVARPRGAGPFTHVDVAQEEVFASQAAVALAYVQTQEELQRLTVLEDRERIARELHDTVIQRLFATGMRLQAMTFDAPEARDRIEAVVDELDAVIREVRSTIFALESAQQRRGVRAAIVDEVHDWSATLGFSPQVRFEGPVDAGVDDPLAEHLLAALREMLSNVAKHALASRVEVDVRVDDEVVMTVVDDGAGLGQSVGAGGGGLGLRNLEQRARALGGDFEIGAGPLGGTRARWQVPVAWR